LRTRHDPAGKAVRAWRVTSKTDAGEVLGFTPSLVGGDPVVALAASRKTAANFLYEYLVLAAGTDRRDAAAVRPRRPRRLG
jgi:hypothetical protein